MEKNSNKKGISLIVLVITIVVIIILAATVIIQLNDNDPISNATKASFLQDVTSMQDQLTLYISTQRTDSLGKFKPNSLNSDYTTISQNWNQPSSGNIYIVLPDLSKSKLDKKIKVQEGKIVYINSELTEDEKKWMEELGIQSETIIDLTGLKALIDEAKVIKNNIADYQETGKQEFLDALDNAEAVCITPISQINVNNASTRLTEAIGALEKNVTEVFNFTTLDSQIRSAETMEAKIDSYYETGKQEFLDALNEARAIRQNPGSQSNIDNAVVRLHSAKLALRLDPSKV